MGYCNIKKELIDYIDKKIKELCEEIDRLNNEKQVLTEFDTFSALNQMFKDSINNGVITFSDKEETEYFRVKRVYDIEVVRGNIRFAFEFDKKITISNSTCTIVKDGSIGYICLNDNDFYKYSAICVELMNEELKKFE